MKLRIQKTHPAAKVPEYATDGAACFDLRAVSVNGADWIGDVVYQGRNMLCDTGLAFDVPPGYMLEIRSRSGLAFRHGVTTFPGTIDSDYRGSVKVLLTCDQAEDEMHVKINPGDRIAQAALVPVPRVTFEVCEQLTLTNRGAGGFGSTGL